MVNHNYQIASRHYSYSVLRSQLTAAIRMFFGDAVEPLTANAFDSENEDFLYIETPPVMVKRYDSQDCRISR
jgi:hypothetical protein